MRHKHAHIRLQLVSFSRTETPAGRSNRSNRYSENFKRLVVVCIADRCIGQAVDALMSPSTRAVLG
ncbi:hypothetical protein C8Q79DRAFT_128444 [Trametes meyenii]|nr:hypothetical protein C8Q79DRAFT_128444 [Trametes meyenii]